MIGQIEVKFKQNNDLYLDVKNSRNRLPTSNYGLKNDFS